MVKCIVCGCEKKFSLQSHINKTHHMKVKDFMLKFNLKKEDIMEQSYRDKCSLSRAGKISKFKGMSWEQRIGNERAEKLINKLKNKVVTDEMRQKMKISHWANKSSYDKTKHPNYGNPLNCSGWCKGLSKETDERVKKLAFHVKLTKRTNPRKHTEEEKIKIGLAHRGRKRSNETRLKMRENVIKKVEELYGRFSPNVSKNERAYLEFISNRMRLKIHRQYRVLNYWLDGYCKKKNIAFEIDEPRHFDVVSKELLERDKRRMKEIVEFLKCDFYRLKYDNNFVSKTGETGTQILFYKYNKEKDCLENVDNLLFYKKKRGL